MKHPVQQNMIFLQIRSRPPAASKAVEDGVKKAVELIANDPVVRKWKK
jgi:hypothetical protein